MKQICSFFSVLLLANCAGNPGTHGHGMPSPANSKYITGIGGGVMTQAGGAPKPFNMSVYCRLNENAPGPLTIVAQFDSPAPGVHLAKSRPQRVSPGNKFSVESSSFARIRNNQTYQIHIKAFKDSSCTQLADEVTESIRFAFPTRALATVGIEDNVL